MQPKAKALVVDDDPIMRELYAEALGQDFDLVLAESGAACLEQVAREAPQVVLMDVEMPGLDGFETCRRLRAQHGSAPPVLFVSARDQLADRMKGYDAGGSDYVCKPWAGPELVRKMQRMLAAQADQQALASERDEAVQAVLSSADMAGELGVVLDFQRGLNGCADYRAVALHLFAALERYGLDGCLRISGRQDALSINRDGKCSALEWSILESLAIQKEGPRVRPMAQNTSFNFGTVILFVRELSMQRSAAMDEELRERQGRAIDNVALLLEGAVARLAAIDSNHVAADLERVQSLVELTETALRDVARRNHEMASAVRATFELMQEELNSAFIHLGLTPGQEDHLSELVQAHAATVMGALAQGQAAEAVLRRVMDELGGRH